ncbi:MAG: hypothetical protein GY781_01895 [Gammaproteobacteria bacterium]|nr:hypothetical protein [Gammaproteobacteria bacterium]
MNCLTKLLLLKTCIFIAVLQSLTGCSTANDGYTMYDELPTHQPNDPLLSCNELGHEISLIDAAIKDMNNSIVELEDAEKSIGAMNSSSYMTGPAASLSTMATTSIPTAPSVINQDIADLKRAASSFEKRKEFLNQQVNANLCLLSPVELI